MQGKKILVHGGGKIASKIGEQLGITPNYINGRRITDAATIDLVTMVYGGLINKKIVAQLQARSVNAIGLTGADANIIPADKTPCERYRLWFRGRINSLTREPGEESGINSLELFIEHNICRYLHRLPTMGMARF